MIWEKITKGRAEIRWDNLFEKMCEDIGGNQEEILAVEKFGRVQGRCKRNNRRKRKTSAKT